MIGDQPTERELGDLVIDLRYAVGARLLIENPALQQRLEDAYLKICAARSQDRVSE